MVPLVSVAAQCTWSYAANLLRLPLVGARVETLHRVQPLAVRAAHDPDLPGGRAIAIKWYTGHSQTKHNAATQTNMNHAHSNCQ